MPADSRLNETNWYWQERPGDHSFEIWNLGLYNFLKLLGSLQQKGAIGRFAALRIDCRAKKSFNAVKAALCKHAFYRYTQASFHGGR